MSVAVVALDRERQYLVPEVVGGGIFEEAHENVPPEKINAHGRHVGTFHRLPRAQPEPRSVCPHVAEGVSRGLLAELKNFSVAVEFHQAQRGRLILTSRNNTNRDIRIPLPMALEQLLVVHPVELVACKDQLVIVVAFRESMQM